ncbi:MBL fold metallo-hydrolase [Oceanicella sp. SM1341]|uniref:MBL fold metallo-hydrolase n=1 Tax=Oceanicella sp. SM1341 TaxID=1548889 RepID=UPI001E480186|nr:MBL fold metallo-hydrolase [Oceanicella sp. SM1341]
MTEIAMIRLMSCAFAAGAATLLCLSFLAPARAEPWAPSHCVALAQNVPGVQFAGMVRPPGTAPVPAAFADPLTPDRVRLHFLGHASFLLETEAGLRIVTDYTGYSLSGVVPDVVTMNKAHSSHFTSSPDPAIAHVLRGWGDTADMPAEHYLEIEDTIIRNVTTDIRSYSGREPDANSIFVFEVAGLCIGHLGHLHHEPSPAQYAMMGRLDVVMAPVDGGYTMDLASMIRVLDRVKARVVLPMHWFGPGNLERFLAGMPDGFEIRRPGTSEVEVSLADLPREPTVIVLEPRPLFLSAD